MKKIILFTLLCLGLYQAQAQEIYNSSGKAGKARYKDNQTKKGFDPNKLVFGGGMGLSFGTITNISIQPFIGYRITDKFAAGIALGYNYYNQKNALETYNINNGSTKYLSLTQSIYTGGVWTRYMILPNVILQAQFELNSIDMYDQNSADLFDKDGWRIYPKSRLTIPSLLLGAGYRFPVTEHSSFYMLAMYDVLQDIPSNTRVDSYGKYSLSPYANTLNVRVGFSIGF